MEGDRRTRKGKAARASSTKRPAKPPCYLVFLDFARKLTRQDTPYLKLDARTTNRPHTRSDRCVITPGSGELSSAETSKRSNPLNLIRVIPA